MNETPAPRPAARTRTTTYVAPRRTIRLALPDGWARSALSGIETILMAWAFTTIASIAAYATVASNPWMGKTSWEQALAAGTDILAVVLGAPVRVGGVAYRATPTLVGVGLVLVLRLLLRPGKRFPAVSQWFAVPAFALVALLIVSGDAHASRWWESLPGALLIPGIAAGWAYVDGAEHPLARWGVPETIRQGIRQGILLVGGVVAFSLLALCAAMAAHTKEIGGIHALLLTNSSASDVLVALGQIAYAPVWCAWTLAWLLGPGVRFGVDALHSPVSAPTLPIPGIPVLGAVPAAMPGYWTILLPIGLGALVGWRLGSTRLRETAREQALIAAVGALVLLIAGAAWFASSVLVLGNARLAHMGPDLLPALAALFFEVGGAFVVASVAVHPETIAWAREQWRLSRLGPGETLPAESPLSPVPAPIDEAGAPESDAGDPETAPLDVDGALGHEEPADDSEALDGCLDAADDSASDAEEAEADEAGVEERPAPIAPIPITLDDILGPDTEHVTPAVKSPAEQAAEADALPEGTEGESVGPDPEEAPTAATERLDLSRMPLSADNDTDAEEPR